uniref:LRRCT domain-containing protein n=1 Tax=Knipowitschia caucasica TaxID=637954 RepID=A0AAV2JJN1_KNICA
MKQLVFSSQGIPFNPPNVSMFTQSLAPPSSSSSSENHTKPLDSVEEVRDRRPLDSVEEVRDRRPLDSVEEVRDRRPLDSVEEVRVRRPLDSVEEVRDRRPLDSVEEVRDRRPLDSVEEVRVRRPLDSVEEVRDRRPLDSVEEVRVRRPLDSVEEVRDRRPLDSVEEVRGGPWTLWRRDLSRNRIGCLVPGALVDLSSLSKLNLSGNIFSTLSPGLFRHLTALKVLHFKTESLFCDCQLQWLLLWAKSKSVRIGNDTTCSFPTHLHGLEFRNLRQQQLHCDRADHVEPFSPAPRSSTSDTKVSKGFQRFPKVSVFYRDTWEIIAIHPPPPETLH